MKITITSGTNNVNFGYTEITDNPDFRFSDECFPKSHIIDIGLEKTGGCVRVQFNGTNRKDEFLMPQPSGNIVSVGGDTDMDSGQKIYDAMRLIMGWT